EYRWARRAPVMILPHAGDLFFRDAVGAITQLTDSSDPVIDPKLCDDGTMIAYVKKGELFLMDTQSHRETRLTGEPGHETRGHDGGAPHTPGAAAGVTRGLSDFLGQEEFDEESGFWWSPRCDRIAYLEVDERKVEVVPVMGYRESKPDL